MFSWRFLRQVSFYDMPNFHGRQDRQQPTFFRFSGNVEEHARIMQEGNFPRKVIEQLQEKKDMIVDEVKIKMRKIIDNLDIG